MDQAIQFVLTQFGLDPGAYRWSPVGRGHIHTTLKLEGAQNYILQRFNSKVFTKPEVVERNIRLTATHLRKQDPGYLFISPITAPNGRDLVYDPDGDPWRLSPFVENSYSVDEATSIDQAFLAAASFGKLGRLLERCDISEFEPTIDRFHDLSLRFEQFNQANTAALQQRISDASDVIVKAQENFGLVKKYEDLSKRRVLKERIFHNDTKINNVLFHTVTNDVLAVVDLDTLMPGYFIYDLGDLVRTMTSPVSEEESDLNKVSFRKSFYDAVVDGYMSEMRNSLTDEEKKHIPFAGQMMTYIMALRFTADYLRGDTYYHTTYPGQNLVRARNQFRLLELLIRNT